MRRLDKIEAERLAKEAAKRDAKLEAASQIEDNKN